ncbi:MAG: energy-coupled thiamine transporter ThiT [Eubacteriales bacterium]|nr:energy-coupled thiamine transporter ThiT [Eubacteriales bacterium]MDD3882810.1 energy-coupled thiamine transporter ThiT [Eubacteriales bacterium]MDD4513292.1 energy-coupled thiamine transporter ThiT [Eubacteriales bacterium]
MSGIFLKLLGDEAATAVAAATEAPAAAEAAEPIVKSWFTFKFGEVSLASWIILAALIIMGAVLLVICRKQVKWSARMIANGALCLALAFVLSYIRIVKFTYGGSITPASMLPIMLFSMAYGVAPGLLVGTGYGLLQLLQGAEIVHPIQLLLDYPLAFAALAIAGIVYKAGKGKLSDTLLILLSVLAGGLGRWVMATLSGALFFASYAPEGTNVWLYTIGYNAGYLAPDTALCMLVAILPGMRSLPQLMKKA